MQTSEGATTQTSEPGVVSASESANRRVAAAPSSLSVSMSTVRERGEIDEVGSGVEGVAHRLLGEGRDELDLGELLVAHVATAVDQRDRGRHEEDQAADKRDDANDPHERLSAESGENMSRVFSL